MQDNKKNTIRLIVSGYELSGWDDASIDNSIEIPAASWSVTLFNPVYSQLPNDITAGKPVQLYYGKELILTGIVDQISEAISRGGRGLQLSGRDLAGQLIDCAVPIFNGRQMTLRELIDKHVQSGNLAGLFPNVEIQDNSWLKNQISVEPGESLWDAITKAAQVTGQHVWIKPDGTLCIGDPFKETYQPTTTLSLMFDGTQNNILNAEYEENASDLYTEIKVLSQDRNANHILAQSNTQTNYDFKRLKIVTMGDVETKAEANAALKKMQSDNNLKAYSLSLTVAGWQFEQKVWMPGWYLHLQSDVLSRTTAKWALMSRTLQLSRNSGQTTHLKLKRQGDWAQPLVQKQKRR